LTTIFVQAAELSSDSVMHLTRTHSHRLWDGDDPTLQRPLVTLDEPAVGCYALTGESVLTFPGDQSKESICTLFEQVREQNRGKRILLVLDNFSSHV
jgi:hypothetical protein